MAVVAFVVILVVASGSLSAPGWRLATGTGVSAAGALAIASLVAGGAASAPAPGWAAAVVLWAIAVLGPTARRSTPRRAPAPPP